MAITSSHLLAVGKVAKKGRRKRKTKQKILDWKLSNLKMKRALLQRRRRRDCDDLVKSAWGTLMSRGMLTDDMTSLISSPPPTPSPTQTMAERQSSSEYEIDQYTIVFCFFCLLPCRPPCPPPCRPSCPPPYRSLCHYVGHRNVVSTLCEVKDDDRMEIWNTYGRTTDLLTYWSVSDTCMSKNLSTTFTYVLDQVSRIWQSHTKDCFLFSVLIFIKEFNLSIYKFVVIWPFSTFWSLSHILILFQK